MEILIPLLGISAGIIIPLAVFYWQYLETKNKNGTIIEISKNIDFKTITRYAQHA